MSANASSQKSARALPAPDSDFYLLTALLSESERALLQRVRTFMETKVAPVINKFWAEDAFPFDLLPGIAELNSRGSASRAMAVRAAAPCWTASLPWRWHELTPRSRLSTACTADWPWARSIWAARKSRSRNGCPPWRGSRKSAASD